MDAKQGSPVDVNLEPKVNGDTLLVGLLWHSVILRLNSHKRKTSKKGKLEKVVKGYKVIQNDNGKYVVYDEKGKK